MEYFLIFCVVVGVVVIAEKPVRTWVGKLIQKWRA